MCEDMTRDVLCNELIDLTKCIKASECALSQDMMSHVRNMTAIFMSCDDFHYVPMTVQFTDRQYEMILQTARDLRKLQKRQRGNTITDVQRKELELLSRTLTNQLANCQR